MSNYNESYSNNQTLLAEANVSSIISGLMLEKAALSIYMSMLSKAIQQYLDTTLDPFTKVNESTLAFVRRNAEPVFKLLVESKQVPLGRFWWHYSKLGKRNEAQDLKLIKDKVRAHLVVKAPILVDLAKKRDKVANDYDQVVRTITDFQLFLTSVKNKEASDTQLTAAASLDLLTILSKNVISGQLNLRGSSNSLPTAREYFGSPGFNSFYYFMLLDSIVKA